MGRRPLYREIVPDLTLADMMMPHVDGIAVLGALEGQIPRHDYVPILALTADVTVEARRCTLAAGARDFLGKPFNLAAVRGAVAGMIARGAPEGAARA